MVMILLTRTEMEFSRMGLGRNDKQLNSGQHYYQSSISEAQWKIWGKIEELAQNKECYL